MRRLVMQSFGLLLVLLAFSLPAVAAQPAPMSSMSSDVITVLNNLNLIRGSQGYVLLPPNDALNKTAAVFVDDLVARSEQGMNAMGDTFLTEDDKNLEQILLENGYPAFSDGYTADLLIMIGDFDPAQAMNYWLQNWRQNTSLQSRKMVRERVTTPPVFSYDYREVGISYHLDAANRRHFYVLVFGAQPGVLPAVVAERATKHIITESVTSNEVILYISNEYSHDEGDSDFIGEAQVMRISEQPEDTACPTGNDSSWDPYRFAVIRSLEGFGPKNFYVQLCDGSTPPRKLTVTVSFNYVAQIVDTPAAPNGTPTPDVLGIANVTQTAAASATAYAPYLATVENILTATAAASSP